MANVLSSFWTTIAMRGIFATLFGIIALMWPGRTLVAMVVLFGIYALASGIMTGLMAFDRQPALPRGLLIFEAVVGIATGILTFAYTGITAISLLFLIGIWAVVTGLTRVFHAVTVQMDTGNRWLLGINGGLITLLGVLMLARPAAGALTLAWLVGTFAIAYGVMEIILGFRLRNLPVTIKEKVAKTWSILSEEPKEKAKK